MLNIIVGSIDKVRNWIAETYTNCVFTEDIFKYINEYSLFSTKKDNVYFLYDNNIKLDKKTVEEFDNKVNNLNYDVVCVIENELDKKSVFYKHFKNKIIYIDELPDNSIKAKAKEFIKASNKDKKEILLSLDKSEYVSFYYAIFYAVYGNNKYKWFSGYIISQILEGQLQVEDSLKLFIYFVWWLYMERELYRYTDNIIAYKIIPKRRWKYIETFLSVYPNNIEKEKHYVIIMKNGIVFEYYFQNEQAEIEKDIKLANSLYNDKIGIETELMPTIYKIEGGVFNRYIKYNGFIYM